MSIIPLWGFRKKSRNIRSGHSGETPPEEGEIELNPMAETMMGPGPEAESGRAHRSGPYQASRFPAPGPGETP